MGDDASSRSLDRELSQLRAIVESLAARQERKDRIEAILDSADRPPPPRRPKRDRHGLHIVRGFGLLAAGGGWLLGTRARRVAAGVATATLLTGGTLTPDMLQQAPAAQVPRHHVAAGHRRDRDTVLLPPAIPVTRKRRRLDDDDAVRAPSAAAAPSPAADPAPAPAPDPQPSLTLPPPTPAPTCTPPHGHHCDGELGEAAAAAGTLLGLPGLPWAAMLREG